MDKKGCGPLTLSMVGATALACACNSEAGRPRIQGLAIVARPAATKTRRPPIVNLPEGWSRYIYDERSGATVSSRHTDLVQQVCAFDATKFLFKVIT